MGSCGEGNGGRYVLCDMATSLRSWNETRMNSWTFLQFNDSHMGTPRSFRFRPAINRRWAAIKRQMAAIDAKFLLHGQYGVTRTAERVDVLEEFSGSVIDARRCCGRWALSG